MHQADAANVSAQAVAARLSSDERPLRFGPHGPNGTSLAARPEQLSVAKVRANLRESTLELTRTAQSEPGRS